MSLQVNDEGGHDFEITPPGVYVARCYRVIDLGTQTGSLAFGGKQQKKVSIGWELLDKDVKMQDGRPFSIHKMYTASLNEKATLRADLESWRNVKFSEKELENFDLSKIIGAYCQIQVVHSEDGKYANVQAIMAYKGDKPTPVNDNVVFDIDKPDMAVFDALSDNMKAKIMSAPEWEASKQQSSREQVHEVFGEEQVDNSDPFAGDEMPDNFLQYDDEEPVTDDDLANVELPDVKPKGKVKK